MDILGNEELKKSFKQLVSLITKIDGKVQLPADIEGNVPQRALIELILETKKEIFNLKQQSILLCAICDVLTENMPEYEVSKVKGKLDEIRSQIEKAIEEAKKKIVVPNNNRFGGL